MSHTNMRLKMLRPLQQDGWSGFRRRFKLWGIIPERCPLAPENARSSRILQQYLFGKRPHVFRAIYTIGGDTVWVLRIRRAQRRSLSAEDPGEYGP
jgi:hypothetical protein